MIVDFENGVDLLQLTSFGFASVDEVLLLASDVGDDLYLDLGTDSSIRLTNFQVDQFDVTDFII